jgi:hypothetical protein
MQTQDILHNDMMLLTTTVIQNKKRISPLALTSSSSLTFVDARWKTTATLGSAAKAANHIMLFHVSILVSC